MNRCLYFAMDLFFHLSCVWRAVEMEIVLDDTLPVRKKDVRGGTRSRTTLLNVEHTVNKIKTDKNSVKNVQ